MPLSVETIKKFQASDVWQEIKGHLEERRASLDTVRGLKDLNQLVFAQAKVDELDYIIRVPELMLEIAKEDEEQRIYKGEDNGS